ncbi:hypothetical protein KQQSB11_350007 [Klebsiella quasipneumoniae subsp. quasipneumoniae]|nr:hypothetical protein KQQSB11_350007 [Klebsiella quasipneumoniae subsp. quasipneumoniae]
MYFLGLFKMLLLSQLKDFYQWDWGETIMFGQTEHLIQVS